MQKAILLASLFLFNFSIAFSNDWGNAQWIWQQEDGPSNTWMSFRRTVHLDEVPEQVEALIAVDSKFWLWVNGEMVLFEGGLARGPSPVGVWDRKNGITPSNSWFETVDIKSYLKKGENTIAILTWYWGRETHKGYHIDSKKGGLLFYADMGNQKVVSDATWKAIQHPGYDNTIEPASKNIIHYSVQFDAQKGMNDWTVNAWYKEKYDDSHWPVAVEKGKAGAAPWYELEENFVPLFLNHGLADYENHSQLQLPFISKGQTVSCRLPFNGRNSCSSWCSKG